MNIEIQKLSGHDIDKFEKLIRLFENVFEMENFTMPCRNHLQQLLEQDSFFVFVALAAHDIVGGLTAYTLEQYYSTSPLVYVYDLAVKKELQRRGIGKNLMTALTTYCIGLGIEEIFVQADAIDDHTIEFYHSTGVTSEKVIHFYYPLNKKQA